jgi:zinc transport system substrate-binding protein
VLAAVLCAGALTAALAWGAGAAEGGPLEVFAGIPPQAHFVERVGGDHVKVNVLVQPGREPHTFEPTPRQMVALSHARLYFKIGMPFENVLLEKIRDSNPDLVIVDTTKGIEKRRIAEGEDVSGEHHEGHGEEDLDPHVWLSPRLIKVQAANIRDALVEADPEHTSEFNANFEAFAKEVDETHERIAEVLAPFRGRTIYVYHPAFGYFADAYGLRQVAIETGGKSPTPRQLGEIIEKARAEGVRVIFVQPQFAAAGAQVVADAIDGAVVPLDDLAEDVLANLEDMAEKVREALTK